jgi:signal transduction histidine kinase
MATARPPERLGNAAAERPGSGAQAPLAAVCVVLIGGVVAVMLAGAPPDERVTATVVFALLVGVPMLVGLAALHVRHDDRFARLLFAAGAMFTLTALSQSSSSTVYSVGRVAVWVVVPVMLHLILAFPSGRLVTVSDRRLMAVIWAIAGLLYLPTALIVSRFPEPSPFARCGVDCPPNAFALVHVDAGFVDDIIQPGRELVTVLAFVAVVVLVARRTRRSGPMLRRAMSPVLVVAVAQVTTFAVYLWSRRAGNVSATVDVLGWLWLLTLPAVALSFAFGLVNRRVYAAAALQQLTLRLRAPATAQELRGRLADAVEDPSLRVVYWLDGDPGRWVDDSGWPTTAPEREVGRAVTEVTADGRHVAAVLHDPAVGPDTAFIRAAAAYGLVVLENTRLIGELRSSLRRLSEAESRRAAAAKGERERIGRDLHDGAQQRLVALRVNLSLLAERLEHDGPVPAGEVEALAGQVDRTIDEVRALAHDPYPGVLARDGLAEALRSAATQAPVPTSVFVDGLGRFDPDVETTVYFACLEALQNAVKHARGATRITIFLMNSGQRLRFEVRDDGAGFPDNPPTHGAGLANITDRLNSVGGRLTIASGPGLGTRVIGTIPIG